MRLENAFTVDVPLEQAWQLLLDVERIAGCMPGAELLEKTDDRTFKGRVSVRLGPVALAFEGVARFTEIDAAAHRATVQAQGTDRKGRGGAHATVAMRLEPAGEGTSALIVTDLQLSGSVAQYGRASGLIAAVAKDLVDQFAADLGRQIEQSRSAPAPVPDAKPISALALAMRLLRRWIATVLGSQERRR